MKRIFGRLRIGPRTSPGAVAFALDLTTEAIILHERTVQGLWKKFASVRLDDTEFPIVMGLLRTEAEAQMGSPQPVRIWLPGEQVLKLRAPIKGGSPGARLRAGFDHINTETAFRPEDVAIAVAPDERNGETTLLVTFVETWREAMDYTALWGFIPGDLSTRAHSEDFGPDGPVFRLKSPPPKPKVSKPKNRHHKVVAALMLVAVAGGVAVWSLAPWENELVAPDLQPATKLTEAVSTPSTAQPSNSGPLAAPEPTPNIQASPPRHFTNTPTPAAPTDTDQPPGIVTALKTPVFQAPVYSIATPTMITAAPAALPDPEPEPLLQTSPPRHFPNIPAPDTPADADQPPGVVTALKALDFPAPIFSITPPMMIATAPLLPPKPEPDPLLQASAPRHLPNSPAPAVPADTDQRPGIETALKAPEFPAPAFSIAAPTVIAAAPAALPNPEPEPPGRDPVVRWIGTLTALKPPRPSSPPVLLASIEALKPLPDWRDKVSLLANATSSSKTTEPVPIVEVPPAEPDETAIETIKPIKPEPVLPVIVPSSGKSVEWAEPSKMLASIAPGGVAAGDIPVAPLAEAEPALSTFTPHPSPAPVPRPERAAPDSTGATEVASIPDEAATTTTPTSVPDTPTQTVQENPVETKSFASSTSPLPASRPAAAVMPSELPTLATLPALTSSTKGSPQPVITEPAMPIDPTMLVGILSFESGRKALLRLPDGDYRYVIVGDIFGGWRISSIGTDAMRLTRNGAEKTLLLINR